MSIGSILFVKGVISGNCLPVVSTLKSGAGTVTFSYEVKVIIILLHAYMQGIIALPLTLWLDVFYCLNKVNVFNINLIIAVLPLSVEV